ncbi:MAG: hypothetical protein NTV34_14010 [Proteobacteria bacterium]|nr:hypothetical protein [Pseudomonadota bacterium]
MNELLSMFRQFPKVVVTLSTKPCDLDSLLNPRIAKVNMLKLADKMIHAIVHDGVHP